MSTKQNIERLIVIGLISSTEFINEIQQIYSVKYLQASSAKRLAVWCMEYFNKYQKAPGKNIEAIYFEKLNSGLDKDLAEDIEDIISDLSEEFAESEYDITYLLDQAKKYFSEKHLQKHNEKIAAFLADDKLAEAEAEADNYKPLLKEQLDSLNPNLETSLNNVDKAFAEAQKPLISYPGALGQFWNDQMVREGFVSLLAAEKRGKTWWLMDFLLRASKQRCRVALFQAGDMSESQMIRRICINLTKTSDREKFCGKHFQPVRDCIKNQMDTCQDPDRECSFGIFESKTASQIRTEITLDELKQAYIDEPDYKPCRNCKAYNKNKWGAVWVEEVKKTNPLTVKKAKEVWEENFIKKKKHLRISTHPNGTLSVSHIKSILSIWEKDGFIPDVIIIDYADLLIDDKKNTAERDKQNQIWKDLRGLSQAQHCLVVTATQSDADSYDKYRISQKNFSEDKRKYGHVTAMYGLNQDPAGREKKIGLMRINKLVVREDYFDTIDEVYVLQNIRRGLPYIGSFN